MVKDGNPCKLPVHTPSYVAPAGARAIAVATIFSFIGQEEAIVLRQPVAMYAKPYAAISVFRQKQRTGCGVPSERDNGWVTYQTLHVWNHPLFAPPAQILKFKTCFLGHSPPITNRAFCSAERFAVRQAIADFMAFSGPQRTAFPVLMAAQNSACSF